MYSWLTVKLDWSDFVNMQWLFILYFSVIWYIYFTDIQFWRSRKSLEGLSVRSVFFNVFQSLVVVLYVMDNETNTVVRISVFIGLAIEIWKIHKVINIKVRLNCSESFDALCSCMYFFFKMNGYTCNFWFPFLQGRQLFLIFCFLCLYAKLPKMDYPKKKTFAIWESRQVKTRG